MYRSVCFFSPIPYLAEMDAAFSAPRGESKNFGRSFSNGQLLLRATIKHPTALSRSLVRGSRVRVCVVIPSWCRVARCRTRRPLVGPRCTWLELTRADLT